MFAELLQVPGVRGVVRFSTHPAFSTPVFHTFVYMGDAVAASTFVLGLGLWGWLPLREGGEGLGPALDAAVAWLSFGVPGFRRLGLSRYGPGGPCPPEIDRWEKVRALALLAPSCRSPCCDGIDYGHELYDRETATRALWGNPRPGEHPAQTALTGAYSRLLAAVNLTPKQVKDAFGAGDRKGPDLTVSEPDDATEGPEVVNAGKKRRKPWRRPRC
jgi:hypothetical protein